MAIIQQINVGSAANDGTGDNLRVNSQKSNANMAELASRAALKAFQADLAARRAGALAGKLNPRANGLYPGTITLSATSALPSGYAIANARPSASGTIANYRPYLTWTPGWAANPGNGMVSVRDTTSSQPNTNYGSTANATNNVPRFYFNTEDPKPIIEIQAGTAPLRVIVDDQYLDLAGFVPGSGNIYLQIDLTKGATLTPATQVRRFGIETTQAVGRVVPSSPIYTVFADAAPGPRLVVQGDSWSTTGGGQTLGLNTWPRAMADWLGCPLMGANALGGTGIATPLASGVPNTTTTYPSRIPDLSQMGGVDALIVGNVTNDWSALVGGTVTQTDYQTYVQNYLNGLRTPFPNTPIVFVSGGTTDETTTATGTAEDNIAAMIATMNTNGDNRIRHVRVTKPANGGKSWLYGTGNSTSPTGNGNRDLYIGTVQAAHPNDAGHAYYGQRAAAEVFSALMSMS